MKRSPLIYFILFTVSGFTGLIYESIWSHYLKLFLGHAAYAQVLVLSIFMGGMALGAYLCTRFCHHWRNLLVAYAAVEFLIGMLGIAFDPSFRTLLAVSHDQVIPHLGTPFLVTTYQWMAAVIMILPQSILLGMTFPLMSNGVIRRFPDTPGGKLGLLYFTNSIGAAAGVLFSGFYLIRVVGLPGTIMTAGIINILLAIIVYGIAKECEETPYVEATSDAAYGLSGLTRMIIAAAFVTGMASFIYEVAWIRMLSMVLGSSTHAFELMLSAFITGLAFGGLWIRRRIDRLTSPIKTAGYIQIIMGLLALATLPLYNTTFEWMRFLISALDLNDAGYQLFTLSSHLICLAIMLPTTFCAGMTLPLFTYILLKHGHGEKSIGQIYAGNTLGAIIGVVLTILFAMPVLGLKLAITIGCALDIILGICLLTRSRVIGGKPLVAVGTVAGVLVTGTLLLFELDTLQMNAGVFRAGQLPDPAISEIVFHKDSKTASIGVQQENSKLAIITNGKPDASMIMDDSGHVSPDELTMVLLGALPIATHPDARLVANIGMGSGLTTHTLLACPTIEEVDTIEIEAAMVEGAAYFRPRVERAFTDPRSTIHIEDAKTYFSAHRKKYDIIISEPSNPWVSGIASLFTDEFYDHVKDYLSDEGLFVQWLQMYETNPQLLMSVLAALKNNFPDFSMYTVAGSDLIFIASKKKPIGHLNARLFDHEAMRQELARIGVHGIQDLNARFIANHDLLAPMIDRFSPAMNSDYFPYLDLNATRARFKKQGIAEDIHRVRSHTVPMVRMLLPDIGRQDLTGVSGQFTFDPINTRAHQAHNLLQFIRHREGDMDDDQWVGKIKMMITLAQSCQATQTPALWNDYLQELASLTVPYLSPDELEVIWNAITPVCDNGLTADQQRWFDLIKALGRVDSESIVHLANLLLKQHDRWDIEKRRTQFTAQMTALLQLGDYRAAKILWEEHIEVLYRNQSLPLFLLILYSLMDQNTP